MMLAWRFITVTKALLSCFYNNHEKAVAWMQNASWKLIILILVASLHCNAYGEEKKRPQNGSPEISAGQQALPLQTKIQRPLNDKGLATLPTKYPRPASDWQTREKAFFSKLLEGRKYDVLIVPFQVQNYAVDSATRSLMTAQLALAMSRTTKLQIPDPYLIARALGDGERQIDIASAYQLADKIGAKRMIWSHVGHDRNGNMALTIQSQARDAKGNLNVSISRITKNYEGLSFTDQQPALAVYNDLLPTLLKDLGVDPSPLSHGRTGSSDAATAIPKSPKNMVLEKGDPARDALIFQLLASLTPKNAERTRERLVEKSLLATLQLPPSSSSYRLLKARAYMMLGLRPAALQVLGKPGSSEEKELFAALNGNLPEVRMLADQIKPGAHQLLAELDANTISADYEVWTEQQSRETIKQLKLPSNTWSFLMERAMFDNSAWAQYENIWLKRLLDYEYPVQGLSAESILRVGSIEKNSDKAQTLMDLSVLEHTRRLLQTNAAEWSGKTFTADPSSLDYLDLIESIATDNLARKARFLGETQGIPQSSLNLLDRIESTYKGHPQFTLARAKAQYKLAKEYSGTTKEGLLKDAYMNALNAFFWEQGQSRTAADAWNLRPKTGRSDYGYMDNAFVADLPFHSFYPTWELGGNRERSISNAQAALRNSTSDFDTVDNLAWLITVVSNQKIDVVLDTIRGRFEGNPSLHILLAEESLKRGELQAGETHYRAAILLQPGFWKSYKELGTLLFRGGKTEQASQVFSSYPDFIGKSENPVAVANYAKYAGKIFYTPGNIQKAVPFFEIAARQHTGAAAELWSAPTLKLLEKDYAGASEGYLNLIQRYGDEEGLKEFIGLQHAMGNSADAWSLFTAVQNEKPVVWETASVAHRLESVPEQELIRWAKQDNLRKTGSVSSFSATYLARSSVTDRTPSANIIAAVSELERPVWLVEDGHKHVVRESSDKKRQQILGPKVVNDKDTLPQGMSDIKPKARIKSDLVSFLEAYRALRSNDHASAYKLLNEIANLYDISDYKSSYLLPYLAFAAEKTGNSSKIEERLANFSYERKGFDYYLAKGVISGLRGNTAEALSSLRAGLLSIWHNQNRPVYSEYEYAEICEWLYIATKDEQFRLEAIDWAKKNQKMKPWFAWAYAMEAKLATDSNERQRAIAMAFYLDRNSEHLAKIPKNEISQAVKEFGSSNPFKAPNFIAGKQPNKI